MSRHIFHYHIFFLLLASQEALSVSLHLHNLQSETQQRYLIPAFKLITQSATSEENGRCEDMVYGSQCWAISHCETQQIDLL